MEDAAELLALSRQIIYDLWQDGLVADDDMYELCFEADSDLDFDDDSED